MEVIESKPMEEACIAFGLYLNMTGTAEAVSNALLNLFLSKEKPDNAVEFIRENLDHKVNLNFAKLKKEIQSAEEELAQLNDLVAECKAKSMKLIEEQAEALELDGDIVGSELGSNAMGSEIVDGSAEIDKQSLQSNAETTDMEANVASKSNADDTEVDAEVKTIENAA